MDKKSLNIVSQLVAIESLPKSKKGESLEDFVKRAYPKFEKFVNESSNPVIQDVKDSSKDLVSNAISKLEVRRLIVSRYCDTNDTFGVEPPKEATVDEILDHNGVKADAKTLQNAMGKEAFDDYIKRLKTPAKDGKTQTQINAEKEAHYSKYVPVFPSEKTYSHNQGGSTRGYHWEKSLQKLYVDDHVQFLSKFGLSDSFPKIEEDESKDSEKPEPESKGKSKNAKAGK